MKPADKIIELINKSDVATSPDADQRILAEALKHLDKLKRNKLAPNQPNIWRIIMKSPITKLATAAVVIIACVIGLSLWRTTGSGIALADVLARIEQVKAFRYKWILKMTWRTTPDKPHNYEGHATELISQEYGSKTNCEEPDPNGGESIFQEQYFLPQKKTLIHIWPKQKKYSRRELDDYEVESYPSDPRSLIKRIKRILGCKYESLGRSTIDGTEVEGFRTTDPNYWGGNPSQEDSSQGDFKIWVDVKTRLPVRYEEFSIGDFDRKGNKIHQHFVMHDFKWDVLVDAAEFEPVIPDDYTRKADIPVVRVAATEENVIKALKLFADLSGNYPEGIGWVPDYQWSAFKKSETPAARRLQEEIKGLTKDEKANKLRDALEPLHGLHRFYRVLRLDEKRPAYYGMTVTPKDADKVLMRWKVSDNEYRVIYGDLHAETVTPEKLAELEAALPK